MRLLLVPALALLFALAPAADEVVAPLAATLDKNANVRFGPSTGAKVAVTLKAGTQIEVFGPSRTSDEWLVVRLPREAKVWVHGKNLKAIDGGKRFQVVGDKIRARNDATLSADVVAELSAGEVVEDKGLVVGDWRAVHIPDAVAYVHKSLITLPADVGAKWDGIRAKAVNADLVWQQALATYAKHVETVKASPKAAIGLDWAGLAKQLDVVISDHASASVKSAAQRVRASIAALIPPAQQLAPTLNIQGPASLPEQPNPVATAPAVPTGTTPAPQADPARPLTDAEVRGIMAAQPPPSPWQAEGMLVQQDEWQAKVGTREVLMDGDGNIIAFIKAKDGVDLKLSELLFREVGAKGEVLMAPVEQTGLGKPTKVVVATEVAPLRR